MPLPSFAAKIRIPIWTSNLVPRSHLLTTLSTLPLTRFLINLFASIHGINMGLVSQVESIPAINADLDMESMTLLFSCSWN